MISSKKNDEILKAIVYIKSKKTINSHKVTLHDLMSILKNKINNTKNKYYDKVKSFRMQEEFGPKKRLKP